MQRGLSKGQAKGQAWSQWRPGMTAKNFSSGEAWQNAEDEGWAAGAPVEEDEGWTAGPHVEEQPHEGGAPPPEEEEIWEDDPEGDAERAT